jgi:hypothetical protein
MARFNALRFKKIRHIRSKAPSPMALTVPSAVCGLCFHHHPDGNQAAFLTGLAHLYNLTPYQRRVLTAGKCGVEVEGGCVPTSDWMLNLQILTSGGSR